MFTQLSSREGSRAGWPGSSALVCASPEITGQCLESLLELGWARLCRGLTILWLKRHDIDCFSSTPIP